MIVFRGRRGTRCRAFSGSLTGCRAPSRRRWAELPESGWPGCAHPAAAGSPRRTRVRAPSPGTAGTPGAGSIRSARSRRGEARAHRTSLRGRSRDESRLLEMAIGGQGLVDPPRLHQQEADGVAERVGPSGTVLQEASAPRWRYSSAQTTSTSGCRSFLELLRRRSTLGQVGHVDDDPHEVSGDRARPRVPPVTFDFQAAELAAAK